MNPTNVNPNYINNHSVDGGTRKRKRSTIKRPTDDEFAAACGLNMLGSGDVSVTSISSFSSSLSRSTVSHNSSASSLVPRTRSPFYVAYSQSSIDFDGVWKDGKPWNGQGLFKHLNGSNFDGVWKEGKPWEGKGLFTHLNGSHFDGVWKEGKPWEGKGFCNYPNGSNFKGEFKKGGPWNGRGLCKYLNDSFFEGEWRKGEAWSGRGELKKPDGKTFGGEWREGKFLGDR